MSRHDRLDPRPVAGLDARREHLLTARLDGHQSCDPRLGALQVLGFSPRHAAFLAIVALHGGYCLRRQYVSFAGVAYGKNARAFLDSVATLGLADRFTLRKDRGFIYHLNARPVYRLLGVPTPRPRPKRSSAAIARRIMLLDFVLANQPARWFSSAAEKAQFFTEQLHIPANDLPQRRLRGGQSRSTSTPDFFPHALPISLEERADWNGTAARQSRAHLSEAQRTGEQDAGLVTFICLLTLAGSDDFTSFLSSHASLLRQLKAWQIIAIAPARSRALEHCQFTFSEFLSAKAARLRQRSKELRAYFTTRRAIDLGRVATLQPTELDRFRAFRTRFGTTDIDDLYRSWLTAGDAVFTPPDASATQFGVGTGTLVTQYLTNDYSQFGSMPGVA